MMGNWSFPNRQTGSLVQVWENFWRGSRQRRRKNGARNHTPFLSRVSRCPPPKFFPNFHKSFPPTPLDKIFVVFMESDYPISNNRILHFFFFFLTVWELNMMQKATSVGMVFTSWQLGPAVKSQHLIGHPVAGIISQTFCSKLKFTYEQHYYLNNQPLTKPLTWPKLHHVVSLDKLYSE